MKKIFMSHVIHYNVLSKLKNLNFSIPLILNIIEYL